MITERFIYLHARSVAELVVRLNEQNKLLAFGTIVFFGLDSLSGRFAAVIDYSPTFVVTNDDVMEFEASLEEQNEGYTAVTSV